MIWHNKRKRRKFYLLIYLWMKKRIHMTLWKLNEGQVILHSILIIQELDAYFIFDFRRLNYMYIIYMCFLVTILGLSWRKVLRVNGWFWPSKCQSQSKYQTLRFVPFLKTFLDNPQPLLKLQRSFHDSLYVADNLKEI